MKSKSFFLFYLKLCVNKQYRQLCKNSNRLKTINYYYLLGRSIHDKYVFVFPKGFHNYLPRYILYTKVFLMLMI